VSAPEGRSRHPGLARALRTTTVLTLALALAGSTIGGDVGTAAGTAMVALLIAAPTGRVAWLGVRWFRKGDRRFALRAAALVAVVAGAAGVALLV
jgi:hypothetical protein